MNKSYLPVVFDFNEKCHDSSQKFWFKKDNDDQKDEILDKIIKDNEWHQIVIIKNENGTKYFVVINEIKI